MGDRCEGLLDLLRRREHHGQLLQVLDIVAGARERSEDYSSSRGARVAMGAGMVAMVAATVVVGVVVGLSMSCGQCIGTLR